MNVNLVVKWLEEEKQVQVQLKSKALFRGTPAGNKSGSPFLPAPNPPGSTCSPPELFHSGSLLLFSGAAEDCSSANPACQHGVTSHVHTSVLFPISNRSHYSREVSRDWQLWHLPEVEPADIPKPGISTPHRLSNSTRLWGKENRFSASCHTQDTACKVLDTAQEIQRPFTLQFYFKRCNLSQPIYLYKTRVATIISFPSSAI